MYGESFFLIRYFSNYYALHRSDLAARAAPLDPRARDQPLTPLKLRVKHVKMMRISPTITYNFLVSSEQVLFSRRRGNICE